VAGVLTSLIVRRLGATAALESSRFILTGVALGTALTAWVGFVVFASDATVVPPIRFWLLGSLTGSTWRALGTATVIIGLGIAGLLAAARTLDLFALGESEARHLGVDVDLVTAVILMSVGGVVGATVGAGGVVVFVGLLVPHLDRRFTGPAHLPLLTASALGGALMMVLSDLASRTVANPVDIPVGLVTAAVGGPFFLWLIRRPAMADPT
jgi:iron complex transport system permease protein